MPPEPRATWSNPRAKYVYPGVLLVMRAGIDGLLAIEDEDCNSESDLIVGVSFWGAVEHDSTWTSQLAPAESGLYVIPLHSHSNEILFRVSPLDPWVARTVILRDCLENQSSAIRHMPVDKLLLSSVMSQIFDVVRQRSFDLLKSMPSGTDGASKALAAICHSSAPSAQLLTRALEQLTISIGCWKAQDQDRDTQPCSGKDSRRPTMRELVDVVGISDDTFRRIRERAGLVITETGHNSGTRAYSPSEVDLLLQAAGSMKYQKSTQMLENWSRWGSNSAAT